MAPREVGDVLGGLFDVAPDGILVVRHDQTIAAANHAFCAMTGWTVDELVGRPAADLVHPDDLASRPLEVDRGRRGDVVVNDRRFRCADGSWLLCQSSVRVTDFGYVGFVRDISDVVREREARLQAEDMYRQAAVGAAIGQAIITPDGTFVRVNPAFCRITGYSEGELVGGNAQEIVHPEDLAGDLEQFALLVAGEIASHVMEVRYLRPDGSTVWVRLYTSSIRDSAGTPVSFVAQVEDISKEKAVEAELRRWSHEAELRAELASALVTHGLSLPDVLEVATRGLADAIGDACVVALIDQERSLLVPTVFHHRDPEGEVALRDALTGTPVALGVGASGTVAATGEPYRVSGLSLDQIRSVVAPQYHSYAERYPPSSLLVVPLISPRSAILGTLGLSRGPAYSDDDERLVSDMADRIAVAIDNARLHQQLVEDSADVARANFLLTTVTDHLPAGVSYWDSDLCAVFVNPGYRAWFGLGDRDIRGLPMAAILGADVFEQTWPHVQAVLRGEQQEFDRTSIDPAGATRHAHVAYVPDLRPDGTVAGFVSLVTDVTARVQVEAEMTELALHDQLTGLLNRHAFMDHLKSGLRQLARSGGAVAVFYLDLNDFKDINDRHGHLAGDTVLQVTADRVRGAIREVDSAARLGGDEFVIAGHVAETGEADEIMKRLRAALTPPIQLSDGRVVASTVAIGLATTTDPQLKAKSLIAAADAAMFADKAAADASR
ncbi:MAG: PAS domain S-box protein [Candidatus Nanopelagicales bacterium]